MNYQFSNLLDQQKLQEFYDGDPLIASGVFEAFVDEMATAVPALKDRFYSGNVPEHRQLVHKIKPGFLYVGLTKLYQYLDALELSCDGASGMAELESPYEEVMLALGRDLPVVQEELIRLKSIAV